MILTTYRTVLRSWRESDAEALYEYASSPSVGFAAGWPAHRNVEESREVIRNIFMRPCVWAVTLKGCDRAVGCIGVICGTSSNFPLPDDEGELSYWIGTPYQGAGLVTEAAREVIRHAFEDLQLKALWCSYFDGNTKSRRVQEKCGFRFHHTCEEKLYELIGQRRIEHVSRLTLGEWLEQSN